MRVTTKKSQKQAKVLESNQKKDDWQKDQIEQNLKITQGGYMRTLDSKLEGREQTVSKYSPYISSHNTLPAVQIITPPVSSRNINCFTTST